MAAPASDRIEPRAPLHVYFTVDVEWWPASWESYREDFRNGHFERYVMGRTPRGTVGLPFQLRVAHEYGLRFVFFVESLFACELGTSTLAEIAHMLRESGQDIQLHAHPEWVRHARSPIVDLGKRYLFRDLSEDEQLRLIRTGLENLERAGAPPARAFRAGSFAANALTLKAVKRAGLDLDSSFKMGMPLAPAGTAGRVEGRFDADGVAEYPLSVFRDRPGGTRHVQLASCSSRELTYVLDEAYRCGWDALVILSHSAELLNARRSRPQPMMVRRFETLCRKLADEPERFKTCWFRDEPPNVPGRGPLVPIRSASWRTLLRMSEQVVGHLVDR